MAVKRQAAPTRKTATPPTPRGKTPPPPAQNEQSGGEGEGEGTSKAHAFDSQKPQGAVDGGKYVGLLAEMVLGKEDEKGQSARAVYEIASEGEFRGQKLTQFYKLFEADKSVGKGVAFLKKDLAVLGYEDVKFGDLEAVFEEIGSQNIGCNITVKQNGQFTNVYLNGVTEDTAVLDEYLAVRTF
jgi:hypothetical protein